MVVDRRDVVERGQAAEDLMRSQAGPANTWRIAYLGSWEYDMESNRLSWSDDAYLIFETTPRE